MVDARRSPGGYPASVGRLLVQVVRALAFGFALLASRLVAPPLYALRWRRRPCESALAPIDTPIATAAVIEDRIEEAGALAELGLGALAASCSPTPRPGSAVPSPSCRPTIFRTCRRRYSTTSHSRCTPSAKTMKPSATPPLRWRSIGTHALGWRSRAARCSPTSAHDAHRNLERRTP